MKRITAIFMAFCLIVLMTACAPSEPLESISQPAQSAQMEVLPPDEPGWQPPVVQPFSASAPNGTEAISQVRQALQYSEEAVTLIYQGAETLPEGSYAKVTLGVQDGPALMDFYVGDAGFIYIKNELGELATVQIPPLEDELLENYEQAFKLAAAFTMGWMAVDGQNVYLNPEDGYEYGLLTDDREMFHNCLSSLFTERWIEEALENENAPAIEQDGKVYVRLGGRGADITFAFVAFTVEEADGERIVLTQTAYYYDDMWEPSSLSFESKPCELVYTGGAWLFDAFSMYL